jgi:LmbE family N-acetylglucosaminyl deacetylase
MKPLPFRSGSLLGLAAGLSLAAAAVPAARGLPSVAPGFDAERLALSGNDRVLVLAPHPDDETLACGGVIQECAARNIPVRVAFLTYGDNNEFSFLVYRKHPILEASAARGMGLVRHDEAVRATGILGLSSTNLVFLGYPDFGTLRIWYTHWNRAPPLRGLLTGARAVPYAGAFRPGAPYKGEELLADLRAVLREFRPTILLVSHPADHNPDHQALYLFACVALWELEDEIKPRVLTYLVHFPRWPAPRGYQPDGPLAPPPALAAEEPWATLNLSPEETRRKHAALQAHRTQCEYSGHYLFSFVRANELFGGSCLPPDWKTAPGGNGELAEAPGPADPAAELTDEERAAFIGIGARRIRLDGTNLVISLDLTKPLARAVESSIYVFGYRPDRPFAAMPKLRVWLGETQSRVYDQDVALDDRSVGIERRAGRVAVRIPLRTLGNPRRILTSARTYIGVVPLDWASWRVLNIAGD